MIVIRNRCPQAEMIIDPQFEWNQDISAQIEMKTSTKVVDQRVLGMVVSFQVS